MGAAMFAKRNVLFSMLVMLFMMQPMFSQKIGYVSSQAIREKFPEAKQAEQRLQTMVDNWKRELDDQQKVINELDLEIKKNRLVWTEVEKAEKIATFERKKKEREEYATRKLGPNGEYDAAIALVFRGVEEKIYAAIQEVSLSDNYDIVWDKATQPLVFINPKYDLTVKVLKKLGINVDDMEKQQQEAIDKDPRNNKKTTTSTSTTTKRTRTRKPAEVPEEEKKGVFDSLKDSVMDGLQDMIKLPNQIIDSTKNSLTSPTNTPQQLPADTSGVKKP
ncbi:MAG: OmpH family outer membrane protein [Bacteroidetes bacterium]|nr:OmpH family outer membrane protein [bacterium]NBP64797.1 OmpH family outer membrane protein [Bacteroidota bacterium]